ncbi:MAG: ABC transporter permease subunit [Spirochaetaceae bacterium]|jgi:ABC-type polysaccharide transport system permease subunit|nr:ABC transporter permease subunit [Spirochaetaceae bacterium]
MFIPYFISLVVAGYVLYALQNPVSGLLPLELKRFGIELPNVYAPPKYWPFILSLSYIWKNIGYMTLLFYTALMGIDSTRFEAAAIDGTNSVQTTFRISIPFLIPAITLLAILREGNSSNAGPKGSSAAPMESILTGKEISTSPTPVCLTVILLRQDPYAMPCRNSNG